MQSKRKFRVIPQSYQAKKGHGSFKMYPFYFDEIEHNKKPKERKDWFYESILRFEKNPNVKCIVYNHHTQSVWLYECYVPSALINKENSDKDYKLKDGSATKRSEWHTLVIFD
jgi:hypothetical protein